MFERPFPLTVDVSFVCLLLGAIFVRGSVVLEETNLSFELGFPTLKKVIRFDLTRFKNAIIYLVKNNFKS